MELADHLADILDGKATIENGVISVTKSRNVKVRIKGVMAKASMVQDLEVAFQPVSGTGPDSTFLCTGEIVLREREVEPFVHTITANGIPITAVHNHWMFQKPAIWYAHWLEVMSPVEFAQITARAVDAAMDANDPNRSEE